MRRRGSPSTTCGSAELRVLLVEDDAELAAMVSDFLGENGFQVSIEQNGTTAAERILQEEFDIVVLDIGLPGLDGISICRSVRDEFPGPIVMLTARGEETDRIVGLEMGADDYLPKTFSSRELLARLRAVTRRHIVSERQAASAAKDKVLTFGNLEIEQSSRTVRLDTKILNLTPIEYDLLASLARAAGRVLTRDQLLDAVAGREYEVFDRSVDVHISSLRRKLGENPRNPEFIQTVRSAGYMFKKPEDQQ